MTGWVTGGGMNRVRSWILALSVRHLRWTALALAIVARAATVAAEPIPLRCFTVACVDFSNASKPGGTVSYAGGDAPLVGSNIPVRKIIGVMTPQHPYPDLGLVLTNGRIDFTTGPLTSFDPTLGYTFGSGTFTVSGAIPALGINTVTPLFTGTTTSTGFVFGPLPFAVRPTGTGLINADVLEHFGYDPGTPFGFGGFVLTTPAIRHRNGSFKVLGLNVDIPTSPSPSPTPEPTSWLLLGAALSAAGVLKRVRA